MNPNEWKQVDSQTAINGHAVAFRTSDSPAILHQIYQFPATNPTAVYHLWSAALVVLNEIYPAWS